MPRIRTIQPAFAHSASMARVNRDARLLFILLWTIADDEGRLRADSHLLIGQLFSTDPDAPELLPLWLEALQREGCIEGYALGDVRYLRIVNWRRHQYVQHPTPSRLPPSPQERLRRSRKSPEASGGVHEEAANPLQGRDNSGDADEFHELFSNTPPPDEGPITPEAVLTDLRRLQFKSEAKGSFTAATHLVELIGKRINCWGGKGAPAGGKEPEQRTKSPGELMREEAAKHGRSGWP